MNAIQSLPLTLAQDSPPPDGTPGGLAETVANLFGRIDALAHPDELMTHLSQLHIALAGVFVACGLVCMLQGFRLYKGVVLIIAAITGISMGYQLGQRVHAEVIVAVCLGVLLAVVAWPLMKYAVAVAGGIAGAFVGANAWAGIAHMLAKSGVDVPGEPWVGALVGLMLLGLLSFILFELSVVLFTSFSGSVLLVLGALSLLMQVESWRDGIREAVTDKPIVLPLLVIVPAVVGLVLQHQSGGLEKKKAKDKGKGKKDTLEPAAA